MFASWHLIKFRNSADTHDIYIYIYIYIHCWLNTTASLAFIIFFCSDSMLRIVFFPRSSYSFRISPKVIVNKKKKQLSARFIFSTFHCNIIQHFQDENLDWCYSCISRHSYFQSCTSYNTCSKWNTFFDYFTSYTDTFRTAIKQICSMECII